MAMQPGSRRPTEVIGRDAEFAQLVAGLRAASDGKSACVLLVGEGGVGKTRLLTETAARASRSGLAVFVGRAAIASPTPFGVIAEALRSWQRDHPIPSFGAALDHGLRLVIPEWSQPAAAPDLAEPQLRLLAFESIVQVFRWSAETNGGALIVLDDLHAADPESVETARYLASAGIAGVCLAAALRPWEGTLADELVRALGRDEDAVVIDVEPLEAAAVSGLVEAITGAAPCAEFLDEIMTRTDGVPLLVEEIVAAHLRAGSVSVADGVMDWGGGGVAVPRTVREMFAARLDRLEAAHRAVVHAGAVLGEFQHELLTEVSGVSDIDSAIEAASRVALLDTSGEVTFRHAIVREAVLASIGAQEKARLHRRSAAALARLASQDARTLERRALHHDALGNTDEAARLLTEASLQRLRSHALLHAESLARTAFYRALEPVRRVAAAEAIAEILVAQGRWTEALDIDMAMSAAYGESPQRRHRMASAALEAGRPELAASVISRAIADGDSSPTLLVVDGRTAMVNGDAQHALSCAARVLSADEGGIDERLAALDLQARALDFLGRRDDAERAWTLLASQAAAEGRTQAQLRAAVALGKTELFAGRPAARLREAVDLARSAGAFVELAWAEENLAIGLVLSGDREEAVRLLDEAIERCRRLRLDQLAYLLAARGMAETYGGGDAEPFLREAEQLLPTDDLRLHTQSGRGDIAMREGRYADAVRCFMVCRNIMAAMPGIVPMDATCWLVWALAGDGRHDEAAAMLAEARSMPDLGRWHTRPILLDAAEALLAGDGDAVDRIVAANTDQLTPADIALIRLVAAETIDVPTRVAWLREALDFYGEAGMTATAQRVRRLLRAAGAPVPRRRQPHSDAVPASLAARRITAREAEVLRLVEDGLSNAEIAELLVVSVRTIEAHVSSLLTKLQADRRSQLVALGVRNTP